MKQKNIVICLFLLLFCIISPSRGEFTDTEWYQYRDAVEFLANRDIVKWYPDGSYGVDRTITRAELLKIVLEATVSDQLTGGESCFPDVDQEEWYAPYLCYAKTNNIIKGYPDGSAKPDNSVTIAEALKIALNTFSTDAEEWKWNDRYQPYIAFVHDNTIFSKFALNPHASMSRGRMAHLVHKLILDREKTEPFTWVRKNLSAWCEMRLSPPEAPTTSVVNGVTRSYLTTIGNEYEPKKSVPLIVAFHGRTNSNTMVRQYYKLDRVTQGEAIIIYPSWLPEWWPSRTRSSPGDKSDKLRDFALFDKIVEDIGNQYCIDLDKVYVVWHSLWAWFTNSLACARGDVIRAIGSVGWGTTKNTCTWPTAAVIMQHPDDNLSSYGAGVTARDQLLLQNGCGPETKPTWPSRWGCVEYTNCLADAPVIRCEHNDDIDHRDVYYPHKRPDWAGQYIWDFFKDLEG